MSSPEEMAAELAERDECIRHLRDENRMLRGIKQAGADLRRGEQAQPMMAGEMSAGEKVRQMAKDYHAQGDRIATLAELLDSLEPGSKRWVALKELLAGLSFVTYGR